jgi:hypothetical protein
VSAERFISFQFCDDIRHEVGNKFSLIGCYTGVIQIDPIPSVMPKLCAMIKVHTSVERPFSKLVVRILRENKPVAELAFPPEAFDTQPQRPLGATGHQVVAMIVMAPFPVESPCDLRVEAETEEGTLLGGSVWIRAAAPAEMQTHTHSA